MDWAEIYLRLQRDRDDVDAWRVLESRVRAWARRDLWEHGWHAVEDCVADTCAAVATSLERAYGAETFDGFVIGLFRNVRRGIRRASQAPNVQLDDASLLAAPDSDPTLDEEIVAQLQRCLAELPPRERQAVELRYFGEASQDEIARVLVVTTVNARQLVFKAIRRLRQCIQPEAY